MRSRSPLDTNDKVDFRLSRNVKVTRLPRLALKSDFLLLGGNVLLHILVGPLEDDLPLSLGVLIESAFIPHKSNIDHKKK